MPGQVTYDRYEVVGDDLAAVSTDIFDAQNGKGTIPRGATRRYAGRTQFLYDYASDWSYDPATATLTEAITGIDWTFTVRVPQWRKAQRDAAPAAQQREFRRFLGAVTRHELGHVYLYDIGMKLVAAALAGTAAGRATVPSPKRPAVQNGAPATPADKAIFDALETRIRALITGHPQFIETDRKQDRYDDPPGPGAQPDSVFAVADPADQPDGTDHGRTQGAVLTP